MREGSELEPTSPTTALTTTRKLGHVTGTENLPPSVAREVAEIVATYQVTGADFLRHEVLKLGVRVALIGVGYAVCFGGEFAVKSVVIGTPLGFCMALPILWRKAPLARAQQHLKESGVGWRARRRLGIKLAAIVGSTPAKDPAKRPGVDEIVALLAPGGEDPWAPTMAPTRRALLTAGELDPTLARSVVSHSLDRIRQERTLAAFFGILGIGMGAFSLASGVPVLALAMLSALVFGGGSGLIVGRLMNRRVLGKMLASLGVVPAEQERIVAALKPLLGRKALGAVPADQRHEVLAQRLVEALAATAPSALPASSSEPTSS
jgi:hypothetical protein